MIGKLIIGVIVILIVLWWTGLYNLLTIHERELVPTNTNIDHSKEASHYLVHGTNDEIIEIERMWFQWDANPDKVLNKVQENKGKSIKFECWGIQFDAFYWYSNCPKIKEIDGAPNISH